jgi:hypothetical protein
MRGQGENGVQATMTGALHVAEGELKIVTEVVEKVVDVFQAAWDRPF